MSKIISLLIPMLEGMQLDILKALVAHVEPLQN